MSKNLEATVSPETQTKPGFKKTKLGWIPKDWTYGTINDLIINGIIEKPLDGNHGNIHPKKEDFVEEGIPFIMANSFREENLDFDKSYRISLQQAETLQKGFSVPKDVLLTHKGTVGETAIVPQFSWPYIILSPQVTYYRVKEYAKLDNYYLKLFFDSYRFQKTLEKLSGGGTRAYIGITNQRKLPFYYPSILEQKKIGKLLKAGNTQIFKLEALIQNKRKIKKGLMQQLLTGKKRLPGFSGEWEKISAGKIFESVSIKNKENHDLLSVTQDRGVIPRRLLDGRVTMPTGKKDSFKLVKSGNFVISLRSFQGGLEFSEYDGLVSPAYTVIKEKKKINPRFYKYYFKSHDFIGHLSIAVIGIRDGKQISYSDFCTVKIPDISMEEQFEIANVLEKIDLEISLLLNKKELLQAQKRGLMQQLLTGKKRLLK